MACEFGDLRFEFRQGKRIYWVRDAVHEGSLAVWIYTDVISSIVAEPRRKVMP
jgi:hypothetical protein